MTSQTAKFYTCLLQMRENRIYRDLCRRDGYVIRPSGHNDEVRLLQQGRLRANHG